MQWRFKGNDLHASVDHIPEGVVLVCDNQAPAHIKTKYPT
jgi:hypothetical protein